MNDLDSELEALAIRSESIADAALAQEWWEAQAALVRRKYEIQPDSRDEMVQSTRPRSGR